jgi:hypothetical protein
MKESEELASETRGRFGRSASVWKLFTVCTDGESCRRLQPTAGCFPAQLTPKPQKNGPVFYKLPRNRYGEGYESCGNPGNGQLVDAAISPTSRSPKVQGRPCKTNADLKTKN